MMLFWLWFTRFSLSLRYRIRVVGMDDVYRKGTKGILFLPNHPALIDPVILLSKLWPMFHTRALADKDQIDRFVIRRLARKLNVLPIEESFHGAYAPEEIQKALAGCVDALKNGDNLILYPSGHTYRTRLEDLGGNSAVERILKELPDIRVVLIRTRGLWGSSFSWAPGREPHVARALRRGAMKLLASLGFFAPRREVTVELIEPDDIPRQADKHTLNRYLEEFYNTDARYNTYVPYTPWESGGPRVVPEPRRLHVEGDPSAVPETTRKLVYDFLREMTGVDSFGDDDRLAHDLGMDSMAGMEMIAWLQSEFGTAPSDYSSLRTVGDVCLAACGQAVSMQPAKLNPPAAPWFSRGAKVRCPPNLTDMNIPRAFLAQARRGANRAILADPTSGAKTNRDLVLACLALRDVLKDLPGESLGVMAPASLGATTLYLACLFAGKTPAMVNWTTGPRNMLACLDGVGVERIVTSRLLVKRLEEQGVDFQAVQDRFVFLEEIQRNLSRTAKGKAYLRSRFCWKRLDAAAKQAPDTAVILFTSGSESQPKAVPLSHQNILSNIADAYQCFRLLDTDSLLGILPPFHSFGLTTSVILPLALGLRTAYWPNPTDGAAMGQMIDAYGTTILAGTPTFLHGIVRASSSEPLRTLRLVVSGAEKCTDRVYQALRARCPETVVLEGYGATECSPIISVNREDDPRDGTIGKILPSFEYVLVDPEREDDSAAAVPRGQPGMLLVRGPCVFDGYLHYDAPQPFVRFDGREWYRTGDIVTEDADGVLTFAGRLKRFVKIGGEMISLPAIESVLTEQLTREDDDGPFLAVVATDDEEYPEIVLFTTRPLGREQVNILLRRAGLSGLHNIRRVMKIEELPLLGTGKCDYRALQKKL
ncbi:MAG: AMP-binding protein [Phycisphaerae bacterium]|nr:AMP-binding protein [Phycisphaerae bacterium]